MQNITGDINPQSAVARPCKALQGCQMMGKAVKWCAKGCVPCVRCCVLFAGKCAMRQVLGARCYVLGAMCYVLLLVLGARC